MDYLKSEIYYGNTLMQWGIFVFCLFVIYFLSKIVYWLIKNVIKKITTKTKTKLDDIIIYSIEKPFVIILALTGIFFSLRFLKLNEAVLDYINKGYTIVLILNIAWLIVRLMDSIIVQYLSPLFEKTEGQLDDQLLPILRKSTKIGIWIFSIVLALNNAGYNVGAILAGLGIGGLAFALAAQDTVKNLLGGFTIFVDKPFTIKDRIQVGGYDGMVEEIGIRSSRIRTFDGRLVIIPNSSIANQTIVNVSVEPSRKVTLKIGLTYDTAIDKVQMALQLLEEIASTTEGLVEIENLEGTFQKKIICYFSGFGSFSLDIVFIYYIKGGADIIGIQNDINFSILQKFEENKIDFAFPTQTIINK